MMCFPPAKGGKHKPTCIINWECCNFFRVESGKYTAAFRPADFERAAAGTY